MVLCVDLAEKIVAFGLIHRVDLGLFWIMKMGEEKLDRVQVFPIDKLSSSTFIIPLMIHGSRTKTSLKNNFF